MSDTPTGSLVQRGTNRWALVIDLGYVTDPETKKKSRKQKWHTIRTTKKHSASCTLGHCSDRCKARKEAETKQHELIGKKAQGTYVEPSKLTLIEYLRDWHTKAVAPLKRPETVRTYLNVIDTHIAKADIAGMPLQRVRALDLEAFYASLKLAPSSVTVVHAVISRALKKAKTNRLITLNPAADVEDRPKKSKDKGAAARSHCWSASETRAVLAVAKQESPQMCAFVYLALDSGARRSELAGLLWSDIDFDAEKLTISRQLDQAGDKPVFGPTKTDRPRTITLGPETISTLHTHRKAQRELMMRNRTTYQDHGLVFARELEHLGTASAELGQPVDRLADRPFQKVIKAAGVKRIKFHGCRHTVATLSLEAGTPAHVVSQRLGHSVAMLMDVYTHALENQQRDGPDPVARTG